MNYMSIFTYTRARAHTSNKLVIWKWQHLCESYGQIHWLLFRRERQRDRKR